MKYEFETQDSDATVCLGENPRTNESAVEIILRAGPHRVRSYFTKDLAMKLASEIVSAAQELE